MLLAALAACGDGTRSPMLPSSSSAQIRDLGWRASTKPTGIVVLLHYNHEAELTRMIGRLEHEHVRRPLTKQEFIARYAPTAEQEALVLRTLRRAGFDVRRRYANRLIVDAVASTATIEQFFQTEIHDFRQERYGVRSSNVRPLRIPPELTPIVAAVEANDLVLEHKGLAGVDGLMSEASSANVVRNGTFDSGRLAPWTSCGNAPASITREHPLSGHYDALTGSTTNSQEVNGWSAICQRVTIPSGANLSTWLYQRTNETGSRYGYQEVAFADSSGKPVVELAKSNNDHSGWVHKTWSLAKYAGKTETLFFGVYGGGRAKYYDAQFVDDVTLLGATPTPSPTPIPGLGPNGGWGPSNVAAGVSMPVNAGYGGRGQTVAIVIDSIALPSDLSAYLQYFNIRQTGTVVNEAVDGGGASSGDQAEATLDLETIASLAPDANVIVYNIPLLSFPDIEDAYNQIVSDGKATVVNSSFSGCETDDTGFDSISDAIAMGAAAQGVTFSASSGDSGVQCSRSSFSPGVGTPASDPHFIGVGGTESGSGSGAVGSITNPAVWNDSVGVGGGGLSTIWSLPSYQRSATGTQPSGRNVPDISLPAAYDSMYLNGQWYHVWGTSWSSPIYVAMQAEINQMCGEPLWGITALYTAFSKSGYQRDFIDVTTGNNAYAGVIGYTAFAGFDQASGIGIPLGTQIAIDNCESPLNNRSLSSPPSLSVKGVPSQ
jgi:subtilase family serine protease